MHRRRPGDHRGRSGRPLPHPLRPAPQRQPGAGAGLPDRRAAEGASAMAGRAASPPRPDDARRRPARPGRRAAPSREPAHAPHDEDIARWTDHYFLQDQGDGRRASATPRVTYAVFMRRPVDLGAAPGARLAASGSPRRAAPSSRSTCSYREGKWVGAGEPMMYITGSLVPPRRSRDHPAAEAGAGLRRRLQRLHHVRRPAEGRLPRHGRAPLRRHRDGRDDGLCRLGRLGAARSARSAPSASSATPPTRPRITSARSTALGTMPHALIGYAGSTVRAAEMFHETFPDEPMTVLVDYFGREITDALAVCRRFPDLAARRATSRSASTRRAAAIVEGLDPPPPTPCSSATCREAIRGYRTEAELRHLVGTGVSAAAIWHLRDALDARRLPAGEDRRLVRLRPGEVQGHGGSPGADRRDRHRLLPAASAGPRPTPPPTSSNMTASRAVKVGREFLLRRRAGNGELK